MTRSSRPTELPNSSAPVGALRRHGPDWALVIAARTPKLRVLDARIFPAGQESQLVAALEAAGVDRVVRLAPARATVARIAEIPRATPAEMNAAAALLAEASLPGDVPAYRRGSGILTPTAAGPAYALLTAWRGPWTPDLSLDADEQTWTTEIAALAALAGPSPVAASGSRHDGAISILALGPSRPTVRVLVESSDSDSAWDALVDHHLRETSLAAGAPPGTTMSSFGSLRLPAPSVAALRDTVDGCPPDPAWLDRFGPCVGAILASERDRAAGTSLAALHAAAPSAKPPAILRAAQWLGVPRHAAAVLGLSAVVALLAPLAGAGARLALLSSKSADLAEHQRAAADLQKRAALYTELESTRWPMTKLWADIAAATPVGVHVENLRLSPEQGLSMQGSAETTELVNTLQENLNATQLFDKLKIARSETTEAGVSFDLSADVAAPHNAVAKPADDFAAKPLAVRLYGEGASATSGDEHAAGSAAPEPSGTRSGSRGDRPSPRPESTSGARPAARAIDIPGPIDDAAITALDWSKTSLEWAKRKTAAGKATDPAVKQRLEDEVRKLDEHRTKLKASGGGT